MKSKSTTTHSLRRKVFGLTDNEKLPGTPQKQSTNTKQPSPYEQLQINKFTNYCKRTYRDSQKKEEWWTLRMKYCGLEHTLCDLRAEASKDDIENSESSFGVVAYGDGNSNNRKEDHENDDATSSTSDTTIKAFTEPYRVNKRIRDMEQHIRDQVVADFGVTLEVEQVTEIMSDVSVQWIIHGERALVVSEDDEFAE